MTVQEIYYQTEKIHMNTILKIISSVKKENEEIKFTAMTGRGTLRKNFLSKTEKKRAI